MLAGMTARAQLPQLAGERLFLTDGGLETTLIFLQGIELPEFAAFPLLDDEPGVDVLRRYYEPYLEIARENGAGFILEAPTWRANADWAARLGYTREGLAAANRKAIALMEEIRADHEDRVAPIVISGCVGPRGDAYSPAELMTEGEAERYHSEQAGTFAETAADMLTAMTLTYVEEAIGIARAAQAAGLPAVISFTVETDGRLPSGQALPEAIDQVDRETGSAPVYYMVNCAHPTHFADVFAADGDALERVAGFRTNASTKSHAELDEAEELDDGDPADLGARHRDLRERGSRLLVVGGCCGTDHRHVGEICAALADS
jgi:S-methylmethionine-dependent homocysteine/selenocysteine methylase